MSTRLSSRMSVCALASLVLVSLLASACGGETSDGSSSAGSGTGATSGSAGAAGTAGTTAGSSGTTGATSGTAGTAGSGCAGSEDGAGGQCGEGPGGTNAGGTSSGGTSSGGTSSGGTSSGGTSSGGTAGDPNSGDCDDAHICPDNGSTCIEIVPGGYRMCAEPTHPATTCEHPDEDACCSTADCEGGECLHNPPIPSCGGAFPAPSNVCAADYCVNDADCLVDNPGEYFCVPRGVFGNQVRYCAPLSCRVDGDCTAKAGGICAPVDNTCCQLPQGLFCVYPDGCRNDGDCTPEQHCEADPSGAGVCVDGPSVCPG